MKNNEQLLFVYNANAGKGNALLDSLHKVFSPQTYDCQLCKITFGVFSEKSSWKRFRKASKLPMIFLHKDEFTKRYKSKFQYKFTFPIVLLEGDNGLEVLISTKELNTLQSSEELIKVLKGRSLGL